MSRINIFSRSKFHRTVTIISLKKTTYYTAFLTVLLALYLASFETVFAKIPYKPQINILADPSLSVAISLIARDYTREHGVAVSSSFDATKDQIPRIVEEGVEADIFITTHDRVIQDLKNQGVVDVYSQVAIAKNQLVLATARSNPIDLKLREGLPLTTLLDAASPDFTLALGDPEFQTVGSHGLASLRALNMDLDIEPHLIFISNWRDLHKSIESKGGYGLIYQSELMRNPNIRAVDTIPESAHKPIIYYAVVIAGEHMEAARRFMDYLSQDNARTILKSHGFDLP